MMPLFFGFGEIGKKKCGALLHLLAVHIENFRAQPWSAIGIAFDKDDLCIAFAGIVVVAAERGNFETLEIQVAQPGEHFHFI